ncbi:OmpA family protein [Salinimicrobium sp. TH3]|uniref:OmpA family protein n=1 Tax=Salinimicrobium sp. TH3 TaxID=2997342 RepID=UPI002274BABC|nr:OmpA family protein [Salinimicrobium sp. TH3]MCY2688275.1 OmpA family protein [Salinimicrobium sp. TH3]
MNKNYFLLLLLICQSFYLSAQSGMQKRADRLYENFAYTKAVDVYKELLKKDYNVDHNQRKLADSYLRLRDPENAVVLYAEVVKQPDISPEYYFKYAQVLRGVRRYDESRQWLKKYLEDGKNENLAENLLTEENIKFYPGLETFRVKPVDFNSQFSDFGAYENNGTVYLTSARAKGAKNPKIYDWNGEPFLDVYSLPSKNGILETLSGDVNTVRHEGPLVISGDGKTMYFTRNNYLKRDGKKDDEGTNHLKIYKASLVDGEWINIEELPFNNDNYSVGHPALSKDEQTLYFVSEAPGGMGGSDIYKVNVNNGIFGTPENLGSKINTGGNEVFPFVAEDDKLYFSSDGHKGFGMMDIFVTDLKTQEEIFNLGEPINSNLDDFSFFISSGDISEGYIASNRSGGKGSDDIYKLQMFAPLLLKGTVTDSINGKPIANATVRLMNENNNQMSFLETDSLGYYEKHIKRDATYPIETKHIKYHEKQGTVNSFNMDNQTELVHNIELAPVQDVEYLAEINKIYFDFDKHNIRPDAAAELDKLVNLMKNDYPELVIEIGSHTDLRGSIEYNRRLAERRAQSTYNYLVEHGIAPERIVTYKGYGEEQPEIDCKNCDEVQHQLNRRSIFKVVKME